MMMTVVDERFCRRMQDYYRKAIDNIKNHPSGDDRADAEVLTSFNRRRKHWYIRSGMVPRLVRIEEREEEREIQRHLSGLEKVTS